MIGNWISLQMIPILPMHDTLVRGYWIFSTKPQRNSIRLCCGDGQFHFNYFPVCHHDCHRVVPSGKFSIFIFQWGTAMALRPAKILVHNHPLLWHNAIVLHRTVRQNRDCAFSSGPTWLYHVVPVSKNGIFRFII